MTLEKAIQIAADAHEGAKDKAGAPYIFHPLRMMLKMDTDEGRIVAVLHDVLEDNPAVWSSYKDDVNIPGAVLAALDCLTHRPGESYTDYITRLSNNSLAVKVKLADLEDNMDLSRISNPTEKDFERLEKYARVYSRLTKL